MHIITRRATLRAAIALGMTSAIALTAGMALAADTVKIGYAVARTGANATGAGITTIPNYEDLPSWFRRSSPPWSASATAA